MSDDTDRKRQDRRRIGADAIAKYYGDPEYKEALDRNPTETLRADGLEVADGANVQLLFDTENLINIVLPASADGATAPSRSAEADEKD